jgi:beta-lactamase class A
MPARCAAMAKFREFLVISLLGLCALAAPAAENPKLVAARRAIEAQVQNRKAEVAIAFVTLDGKNEWFYHADEAFHAASTMKVPVMIELFRQVREGRLKLEDSVPIRNQFRSIVDGSSYKLDPADDSEAELYKAEGQTRTLSELCELMITVSSNLAANLLIDKLGVSKIQATVHALGADGVHVLRGVEDGKAYERGLNNTTTARGLLALMRALALGKAVDPDSSKQMIGILERQTFNEGIPAGLPPKIKVAHKTGEVTKIHHDAAIVYAPSPFVLVVLVRGLQEKKDSAALMADIARELYGATQ